MKYVNFKYSKSVQNVFLLIVRNKPKFEVL